MPTASLPGDLGRETYTAKPSGAGMKSGPYSRNSITCPDQHRDQLPVRVSGPEQPVLGNKNGLSSQPILRQPSGGDRHQQLERSYRLDREGGL